MASPSTTMEEMYHLSRTDAINTHTPGHGSCTQIPAHLHPGCYLPLCPYKPHGTASMRCTESPLEVLDMRTLRATPRGQGAVSPAPNDTACHARESWTEQASVNTKTESLTILAGGTSQSDPVTARSSQPAFRHVCSHRPHQKPVQWLGALSLHEAVEVCQGAKPCHLTEAIAPTLKLRAYLHR